MKQKIRNTKSEIRRKLLALPAFVFCISYFVFDAARAAFEDQAFGVRPLGMAGAFSGISDDANALHANPAGLGQARFTEFTVDYSRLYMGLDDDSNVSQGHFAFAQPLNKAEFGVLGVGFSDLTLSNAYGERVLNVGYGRRAGKDFYAGGSFKWLMRRFASDIYTDVDPLFQNNGRSVTAPSLDLAALYIPSKKYSLGLVLKDLNEPDVGLGSDDRVPFTLKGGFAYYQPSFVYSADIALKDSDAMLSVGAERWFLRQLFAVRGGLGIGTREERSLSVGMSYRFQLFQLDYALVFPMSGISDTFGTHRLSMTARFGRPVQEPRTLLAETWEERSVREMRALSGRLERLQDQNEQSAAKIADLEQRLGSGPMVVTSTTGDTTPSNQQVDGLLRELESYKLESEQYRREREFISKRLEQLEREVQKKSPMLSVPLKSVSPGAPSRGEGVPATYEVRQGDTLRSIAKRFYGDPEKWMSLYQLNKDRLGPGGTVSPGQVLIMPPTE